jgi:hypothetical protein
MKKLRFLDTFKIKYILVSMILIPLLLFYFLNGSSHLALAQTVSVENIDSYENPLFGLSIEYPSSWIIKEFDKKIKNDEIVGINNIVQVCSNTNTLKQVQSNLTNSNITLCQNADKNFAIYAHNLPAEMTLDEFTNSKISSYKLELTDFKIIESNPNIMIDDNPAYKVTYTYTDTDSNNDDKKIQVMEVWTVITKDTDDEKDELEDHVNKAYSIRYEAIPIEFPIYLNTANNTISSFEFKKIDDDKDDK